MYEFVKLATENPDLPIVAMVNGEICSDDSGYFLGAFGTASIVEVGTIGDKYYDDRDSFKEAYYDKYSDKLCKMFDYLPRCCLDTVAQGKYTMEQFSANCLSEEKLDAYLNEMADKYMVKVIAVYVDPSSFTVFEEA